MRRRSVVLGTVAGVGAVAGLYVTGGRTPTEDSASGSTQTPETFGEPNLGANLNGVPRILRNDFDLLDRSNTQWVHAFLDVRQKHADGVKPGADPDVRMLRRIGKRPDSKLIISLLWDFNGNFGSKPKRRLPASGSNREQALFEYATALLSAIETPVDLLVLGNEPIWDTPDADFRSPDGQLYPFTRGLKNYLVNNYVTDDTQLLLGAFNRLYKERYRTEIYPHFHRKFLNMARRDDDIAGIDVHVHYDTFDQANRTFASARQLVPNGIITATEFSPVWRYDRVKDIPFGKSRPGRKFANQWNLPAEMTPAVFYESSKRNPRLPRQMADFMATMPWYNVNLMKDLYEIMEGYRISVATIGFLLGQGVKNVDWTKPGWTPFQMNFLYQAPLIDSKDGAHPHYLDAYVKRT